jgi:nucleotide-binding universal stress UspA family protein
VATARNASHDAMMRIAWELAVRMRAGVQVVNAPGCVAAGGATPAVEGDIRADHVIADAARETNARLVLLGRGRRASEERDRSEKTLLRVLRHVQAPVYAVDPDATGLPRRIVVAVDFSECAIRAAQLGVGLVAPDATVTLVHVSGRAPDMMDWERTWELALPALFDMVLPRLEAPGRLRVETVVLDAPEPASAVATYARDVGADLVIAGAHGQSLSRHPVVGSVALELLRSVPCSFLCASAPAGPCAAPRLPLADAPA